MNRLLIAFSILAFCMIGASACQYKKGMEKAKEQLSCPCGQNCDCDPCRCNEESFCPCGQNCDCDPCRCNEESFCPCGPNCDCDPCRCNEKAEVERPKVVVLYFYADW